LFIPEPTVQFQATWQSLQSFTE